MLIGRTIVPSPQPVFRLALRLLLATLLVTAAVSAQTAGSYQINNILSDGYATATVVDSGFVNPWGFDNTGTFWIDTANTGFSYVAGTNGVVKLKAVIPPASGTGTGLPAGIAKNTTTGFLLSNGTAASFLFGTLDGTISGWNGGLSASGNVALIMVNNSSAHSVYTDIAIDPAASGTVLLAANFGPAGKIEIYNQTFAPTTLPGTFTDPNVPAGYAPYAIHVISGQVYVTYMLRSTSTYRETLGPNTGFISVFDVNGNFIQRAITGGNLNSPWGMALAPTTFGVFGGDLLVGNLGDGLINAYNPTTFAYQGQLTDATGKPVLYSLPGAGISTSFVGLWEIGFGKGNPVTGSPAVTSSGDPNQLYYAAGLDAETHGVFGAISNVAPTGGSTTFGFTSSIGSLTAPPGTPVTASLAVVPVNGFAGTVTLTCSGLPADSSCTFSPASLTVSSSAPAVSTLTISTNMVASHSTTAHDVYAVALAFPFAGLLLFGATRKQRGRLTNRLLSLAAAATLATAALSACSSSSPAPTTPAGTSAVTITATSGSVTQNTTISLVVQ